MTYEQLQMSGLPSSESEHQPSYLQGSPVNLTALQEKVSAGERREANKTSEQCAIKSLEQEGRRNESCRADCISRVFSNADSKGKLQQEREREEIRQRTCDCGWWKVEPDVGRVADGVPDLVDRIRCLGNAVVPQQAYPIFEAIAEFEEGKK